MMEPTAYSKRRTTENTPMLKPRNVDLFMEPDVLSITKLRQERPVYQCASPNQHTKREDGT